MKRAAAVVFAIAVAACTAQPQPAPPTNTTNPTTTTPQGVTKGEAPQMTTGFRLLEKGGNGRAAQTDDPSVGRRAPRVLHASDEASYRALWKEHVGNGPAPAVDFAAESVVFLLMGVQSTGGYSVEPTAAAREGDSVVIDATVKQPGRGGIVTMAITAPYAVVAVPGKIRGDVDWRSEGRLLARAPAGE